MIDLRIIEEQLFKVGMRNRFFGRPEVKELCHVLSKNETIRHAVMGQYEGGFALIVATDHRVLLIDKKPWFLTMEDIRYDMVSEVDFCARLLDSSISIVTINKTLIFTSWHRESLRKLVKFVQQRVTEIRHIETNLSEPSTIIEIDSLPQRTPEPDFSQSALEQGDFASSYQQAQIKRHSLAHVAGKLATDDFSRPKPLIKPLYPRPSFVSRTKQSGFTH